MKLTRKTRIGTIGLGGLLAAALSVGFAAAVAAAPFDAAVEERVTGLGFDVAQFSGLDADRLGEIAALVEGDHDDETLRREIGAILETASEDEAAG
jgi:hypothetical protein